MEEEMGLQQCFALICSQVIWLHQEVSRATCAAKLQLQCGLLE